MSGWRLMAKCPGCSLLCDSDSARFLAVCPDCGHAGEWDFGARWPRHTMRWVPNPDVRFFRPSTWGLPGRWEYRNTVAE